jgi:hypothetical protein
MGTSLRLRRRIEREFPDPGSAKGIEDLLASAVESLHLSNWGSDGIERIQAAIVIGGMGDLARVRGMRDLALQGWRDALVAADLANEDWRDRLDAELGLA